MTDKARQGNYFTELGCEVAEQILVATLKRGNGRDEVQISMKLHEGSRVVLGQVAADKIVGIADNSSSITELEDTIGIIGVIGRQIETAKTRLHQTEGDIF